MKTIEGVFSPEEQVEYTQNSVVSRQIIKNAAGNMTLFSFDQDQQLSEHTAPFDAVAQILDGEAEIRIGTEVFRLGKGNMIIMPANIPHALLALTPFKMLLVMIRD